MDGRHRNWREDVAMIVNDGDDFLALVVLVAGITDAIAPFLATVLDLLYPLLKNL